MGTTQTRVQQLALPVQLATSATILTLNLSYAFNLRSAEVANQLILLVLMAIISTKTGTIAFFAQLARSVSADKLQAFAQLASTVQLGLPAQSRTLNALQGPTAQ